jgi:hypothetical protein
VCYFEVYEIADFQPFLTSQTASLYGSDECFQVQITKINSHRSKSMATCPESLPPKSSQMVSETWFTVRKGSGFESSSYLDLHALYLALP